MPRRFLDQVPASGRPNPRKREPLWDRVDRNRLILAAYVALFVVATVVVFDVFFAVFGGCALGFVFARLRIWGALEWMFGVGPYTPLAVMSAVFGSAALIWALFTLSRSEKWLLRRLNASLVPKGELIDTKMALKDMAIAAGLPIAPALYVLENSGVNAFIFAARRRRAVVGVTRGFVTKLAIDEQRAVFANLIARLMHGDTIVSTGVTALLWPLHAWRDRTLLGQNEEMDRGLLGDEGETTSGPGELVVVYFLFGAALAIIGEVFAAGHRRKQLRSAEKADAEGMLLLRDPRAMLSALQRCIALDNMVPIAGDTFADLFYCYTGSSTDDEDDPEWHRVARLREVLGVEGWVAPDVTAAQLAASVAPPPPRIAGSNEA